MKDFSPRFLMIGSIFFYSIGEVFLKFLSSSYGGHETIFFRSLFSILLAFLFYPQTFFSQDIYREPLGILRAVLATISLMMTSYALRDLQLASFSSLYYTTPLLATGLAWIFLKEQPSKKSLLLLIGGFLSIVVMMNPSTELFSFSGLVALGAVLLYALSLVLSRSISHQDQGLQYTVYALIGCLTSGVFFVFGGTMPSIEDLFLFALMALLHYGAFMLLVLALKKAPLSHIAPYEYTSLFWSVSLGYVVFHDVPEFSVLLGASLIFCLLSLKES